jgi:Predicted Zn-dependent hydrolases of the beta-lactamase fold
MKITKYPQSCILLETNNKKILVDPGSIKYKEEYATKWKEVDYILITHKHGDHVNYDALKEMNNIPIYSSKEVQKTYPELSVNIVKENDIIDLGNISVEVVKAIHGYNPNLKDGGKEVFENIGYIIDDGNKRLYATSDTICFNNNYKADILLCPLTAHGLTMSSYEVSLLSKDLGTEIVLPVHMDNEMYPTDLEYMKKNFDKFEINYKVLEIEESIEV